MAQLFKQKCLSVITIRTDSWLTGAPLLPETIEGFPEMWMLWCWLRAFEMVFADMFEFLHLMDRQKEKIYKYYFGK